MIALTGSTGALGGLVARSLSDLDPRLVVRDASRAPATGGDVRVCTYGDHEAAVAALTGVTTLFMVSAAESATRLDEHATFIRAAAEAGVEHLVYTSFAGVGPDATFTLGRDHHAPRRRSAPPACSTRCCATTSTSTCCRSSPTTRACCAVPPATAGSPPSPAPTWPTWPPRCCATRARTPGRRTR